LKNLFDPLAEEPRRILDNLPALIDKVFPLPARFRSGLPRDVAELSALLTSHREDRGGSYLGKPALLSAYLRYFLPWNIYRLCRLFNSLPLDLKPGDSVNDLGAGPLTLAISLWISHPDLRKIPLEFRCLDRTALVLDAGKKLFTALTAETGGTNSPACPWTTRTIRGELRRNGSLSVVIRGKPAALSAAANVYNELFWALSPHDSDGLESFAENQARLLSSLTEKSGLILVVEPGIPRSGEFITHLRTRLMSEGRFPLSPCTHHAPCPFPGGVGLTGGKAKWCHFAFDTADAPAELQKLSVAAHLPKERAALSFILAGPAPHAGTATKKAEPSVKIRILSDSFPVDTSWGRYGCCEKGAVLVRGSRGRVEAAHSGALDELAIASGVRDEKSGAWVAGI